MTSVGVGQELDPRKQRIVVLTFDDAVKSHRAFVGPYLKELGFGATFFVTHAWMNDPENFMTWEEIAELHQMGFEVGNHSWTHPSFNTPKAVSRMRGELNLVERELKRVGVPKPVSFAWTGNAFCPEGVAVLAECGYLLARRGMQPEVPYAVIKPGPLYDPGQHHPLLIPSAGDAYPDWNIEHFKKVVDRAGDGKIAVVQFHGVPDPVHPWVHTDPEVFKALMGYLKEGGFKVVAMRDLLPLLGEAELPQDPTLQIRHPFVPDSELPLPQEAQATRGDLDFWLPNMRTFHGYDPAEVGAVCWLPPDEVDSLLSGTEIPESSTREGSDEIPALPYPGGRHPRIGFLEGAIDPQRGTKISLFAPWEEGGYVVLDLPEAIFSNLGLTFLAHNHIATYWDSQNKVIDNVDWTRNPDGTFDYERSLPNEILFGAKVIPNASGVQLSMWLVNGTTETLTGLKTQVCAMLKGLEGFNRQSEEGRLFNPPVAAIESQQGGRWLLVAFDRCGRVWGNPPCPCIHSDPVFPDAAPGEKVEVRGALWFYEGNDIAGEVSRAKERFTSLH
jgi:peptidoglycan/xylan/chitin deacetylase (PgdA/CDA1 family)